MQVIGTSLGTTTDSSGKFRISGILPKSYTLQFTSVGYNEVTLFNIVITSGNEINLTVQLEPSITRLEDVVIKSSRRTAVAASLETPLSVQRLTTEEISSNPGGNFDISRVIQALPGVGGTAGSVGGFRNDIIIRGDSTLTEVFMSTPYIPTQFHNDSLFHGYKQFSNHFEPEDGVLRVAMQGQVWSDESKYRQWLAVNIAAGSLAITF